MVLGSTEHFREQYFVADENLLTPGSFGCSLKLQLLNNLLCK